MKKLLFTCVVLSVLAFGFTSCEKEEDNQDSNEVLITDDINTVTTWTANKVYVIDGNIDVEANITIEPGTIIKFKTGATLGFGYTNNVNITANGLPDKRIVFTAYNSTPTTGAWGGVSFYSHVQQNSSITYCDFLYAGYNDRSAVESRCKLTFNNNLVKYAKKTGIELNEFGAFVLMKDNTIQDCGTNPINLYARAIHTLGTNNNITANIGYGILVKSDDVTTSVGTNITWKKQSVPYIFDFVTNIETNLTIEPGTYISFNAGGQINFGYTANSTITAIGTLVYPILFTSSNILPATGAWKGIFLYNYTSPNSKFEYCTFEYAGYDQEACLYIREVEGITVKNSTFRNSSGHGIYLDNNATLSAGSTGNTFSNCLLGNIGTNND